MLPSMELKDAVLEKQSGLEVVWIVDSKSSACFLTYFYHQKNELASTTQKSPAFAASNQLLFKAEKMTEPLKPPA
jgi:CHAT domain-containing protein